MSNWELGTYVMIYYVEVIHDEMTAMIYVEGVVLLQDSVYTDVGISIIITATLH